MIKTEKEVCIAEHGKNKRQADFGRIYRRERD